MKTDVTNELQWDPSINATNVGIAVKNAVVTLTGRLDTFAEKFAIERAVQRVEGVKAVAVELDEAPARGEFGSLAIFASAPFLGELKGALSEHVAHRLQVARDSDLAERRAEGSRLTAAWWS